MPRSESEVREILDGLSTVAARSALRQKNVDKGHWGRLSIRNLLVLFLEEAGEVARAHNHDESLESFIAEIGDAALVLAMLLDNATRTDEAEKLLKETPGAVFLGVGQVNLAAVKGLELYVEEPPMPGCHLELKLLDAEQICGACGFAAKQHRSWKGSKG